MPKKPHKFRLEKPEEDFDKRIDLEYLGFVCDAINHVLKWNAKDYHPHSAEQNKFYLFRDGNTRKPYLSIENILDKNHEPTGEYIIKNLPTRVRLRKFEEDVQRVYIEVLKGNFKI